MEHIIHHTSCAYIMSLACGVEVMQWHEKHACMALMLDMSTRVPLACAVLILCGTHATHVLNRCVVGRLAGRPECLTSSGATTPAAWPSMLASMHTASWSFFETDGLHLPPPPRVHVHLPPMCHCPQITEMTRTTVTFQRATYSGIVFSDTTFTTEWPVHVPLSARMPELYEGLSYGESAAESLASNPNSNTPKPSRPFNGVR